MSVGRKVDREVKKSRRNEGAIVIDADFSEECKTSVCLMRTRRNHNYFHSNALSFMSDTIAKELRAAPPTACIIYWHSNFDL